MRWFGLALLGILIAAAVAFAASRLASQQIGLASEPVSAGDALAPAAAKKEKARPAKQAPTTTSPSPSTPPSTESSPAPVEPERQSSDGEPDHDGEPADD